MAKFRFIFIVLFSFSFFWAQAQNYSLMDIVCIDEDGNELLNPFAGGLNSPQFNKVDIDLDGVDDIMVMDRDGEIVLPFLFKDNKYHYAPEYRNVFPKLKKWVRMIDINKDGIQDIFCYNIESPIDGVEIYFGKKENGKLSYDKYKETFGDFEIIYYKLGANYFNMELSSADLPDMVDVDGDGDIDIVTFEGDNPFVKLFKNTCVEEGVSLDKPQYELTDACWGKFRENGVNEKIKLSPSVDECAPALKGDNSSSKTNVHAGSTITLYDDDADGDFEAIIGDLSNKNMNWLFNNPVNGEDFMTQQDTMFPFYSTPIDLYIFNSAFVLDVDQDGNDDLLAAPNFTGAIQNRKNVWFYKNMAENGAHDFELENSNFLGDEMFDFGSLTNPTTCDFNQDGKKDLIIGVFGEFVIGENPDSRLYLFENVSEGGELKYKLVNDDYLGFLAYKSLYFNYAPSVADLDNDGDDDLMVSTNTGELIYMENQAAEGLPYDFKAPVFNYAGIDVGDNAKVQLVDLNRDGLMDMVLGERNQNADPQNDEKQGNINYFQNQGEVGAPAFNADENVLPNTPALGHVVTKDNTTIKGSATPYFYDKGDSFVLYVGAESGRVKVYDDIEGNFYTGFNEVDDSVDQLFTGKRSAVCVDDLNGDGLLEFVMGNIRGGFSIFGSNLGLDGLVPVNEDEFINVSLYPNPASTQVLVSFEEESFSSYEILSIDGKVVLSGEFDKSSEHMINVEQLFAGAYIVLLKGEGRSASKKLNIIR